MMSHWIQYDQPEIGRGRQRAICGAIVDSTSHANDPSCHACQDALREDDASYDATYESLQAIEPKPYLPRRVN